MSRGNEYALGGYLGATDPTGASQRPVVPRFRFDDHENSPTDLSTDGLFRLLTTTQFGAYAMNGSQTILFWNRGAEQILGHRTEQAVGRKCYEVVASLYPGNPTPECFEVYPSLRYLREGSEPPVRQVRMLCASGQRKLVTLIPLIVPPGVLRDGLMLVHLFYDHKDEVPAATAPYALWDAFPEHGVATPPDEAPPEDAPAITKRQLEVLRLVSLGWETHQIATSLGISVHTVLNHIRNTRRKLGASTKLAAVVTAIRWGIV